LIIVALVSGSPLDPFWRPQAATTRRSSLSDPCTSAFSAFRPFLGGLGLPNGHPCDSRVCCCSNRRRIRSLTPNSL